MEFSDHVALVTGAASGIGRRIAQRFSETGAAVALLDIDGRSDREAAAEMPLSLALAGDVSSEEQTRAAVQQTIDRFGRLDILVNNAAIEINGDVTELLPADWDRQLAVNLRAAYLLARFAVPHLSVRGGSIVNISSAHAFLSWHGCPAYDASKAGLLGLTRALAVDHGHTGIRVNAVCPGYTDTPLMEKALRAVPNREEAMRKIIASHPLGRIGTADDIAGAVLFLASRTASFITGATLVVDGGFSVFGR